MLPHRGMKRFNPATTYFIHDKQGGGQVGKKQAIPQNRWRNRMGSSPENIAHTSRRPLHR